MKNLQENVSLLDFNTLGVAVTARYWVDVSDATVLSQALHFASQQSLPVYVIGGGSNIVLADSLDALVLHMAVQGLEREDIDSEQSRLMIGAGENWETVVARSLQQELYGLENLSLIPGTAGAAPVQNIGAYGVELSEFLEWVDIWDRDLNTERRLTAAQCQLSYRDSVFKAELKDRAIILRIALRLRRQPRPNIHYAALQEALLLTGIELNSVTPQQIRKTVISLRQQKLPDPAVQPNVGSFFKNPVISQEHYQALLATYPDLPAYPQAGGMIKLPAAWLIDKLGWKGKGRNGVKVHHQQALVLVNHGGASGRQILAFARDIQQSVTAHFGLELSLEPRVMP